MRAGTRVRLAINQVQEPSLMAGAAPNPAAYASSGLRLRLSPTLAGAGILDGGWWPRSRDPDTELPALIAGLESTLGPKPPGAAGQAAESAMAMAADATNGDGPAAEDDART